MRFLFMGTAAFACPTLRALIASPHQALAVITQPDRPRGRGQQPAMSAVKLCAQDYDLPVLQPRTLRAAEAFEALVSFRPDIIVVVAYGNILPQRVLDLPTYGCVNLHASLLPKYRGAAPINWTLINGETEAGYTIIQMDAHVDTGPMLKRQACALYPDDDAISLGERLSQMGAAGMVEVVSALERGAVEAQPQPSEGASMAPKLDRELGRLQWHEAAQTLHNRIRGLVPWPGCTARYHDIEVKIWRASVREASEALPPGTVTAMAAEGIRVACGTGHLMLEEIQPANRRRMSAQAFAQGYRLQLGDRFG